MNQRDKNKRMKGFGIPIEICVKFERLAGVKTGQTPTKAQRAKVTQLMVFALNLYSSVVELMAEDYELIAQEVRRNEERK